MYENFSMKKEWARYEMVEHLKRIISSNNELERDICLDILRELLEVNKFEKWDLLKDKTIAEFVIKTSDFSIINLFIEYGVTFNTESLMIALQNYDIKVALFLIDLGVEVNFVCRNGYTPLEYLIGETSLKNYDLFEKLLQRGTDQIISRENILVKLLGNYYRCEKILKLFIDYNFDVSYNCYEALNYAAAKVNSYEIFDLLINAPTAKGLDLQNIFNIAIESNNESAIRYILSGRFKYVEKELVTNSIKTYIKLNYKLHNFIKILATSNVSLETLKESLNLLESCKYCLKDKRTLKRAIKLKNIL